MFRFDYLLEAIPIIAHGILGTFLTTAVIIGVVALLNKLVQGE